MLSSRTHRSKPLIILAVLLSSTLACVGFEKTHCYWWEGGEWISYEPHPFYFGGCCKTTENDCSTGGPPTPVPWDTPKPEPLPSEEPPSPKNEVAYNFAITSCTVTQYSDRNCNCGDTDGIIEISDNAIIMQFIGRDKIVFDKQDENTYENSRYWGEANLSVSTLTLNDTGFLLITDVYDTSTNTQICTFNKIGIFNE